MIYGSSKQGKTTLRRHCLTDSDFIVVSCLNTMGLADLNGAILKKAGYRIEQTQTKTVGGAWKYGAEFAGEGKVPFVAKASGKSTLNRETNSADAVGDQAPGDRPQRRQRYHYRPAGDRVRQVHHPGGLSLPVGRHAAVLRVLAQAFHENSPFCFIIVGVWREQNRLIYYNATSPTASSASTSTSGSRRTCAR